MAIKFINTIRNSYYGFQLKRFLNRISGKSLSSNQLMTEEDYRAGWELYESTDSGIKKPKRQVIRELNKLCKYWRCFPDTYFRFGMFLMEFTDWNRMISFMPQIAAVRYENQGAYLGYGILLDSKILFNELLSSLGFPVSRTIFRYINKRFFVDGVEKSDEEIDTMLQNYPYGGIFAKPSTGSCANGIFVLSKTETGQIRIANSKSMGKTTGFARGGAYIRSLCGDENYQFEELLKQDKEWSRFCPDTINTIRVITINPTGEKEIIVGAAARFGRMGGYVDNLAQGGVAVSIDTKTGELYEFGMREYDLTKYYEHPDTHRMFAREKCPYWEQIKDLIHRVSIVMPPLRMIGWDIALTENGPVIVEMNTGTGVYSVQMGPKYGIAEYFKGYVPTY